MSYNTGKKKDRNYVSFRSETEEVLMTKGISTKLKYRKFYVVKFYSNSLFGKNPPSFSLRLKDKRGTRENV